jgi:peptide/nickel transport system ATP-binding protein
VSAPALAISGLSVAYRTGGRDLVVTPGLDLTVAPGEAYGLVGESGCGKSTVAFAVMGHLGAAGRILRGEVRVGGEDVARMSAEELRRWRGSRVAMVYQDPMSSLNPTMRVGRQLLEVLEIHLGLTGAAARERVLSVLGDVRLPDPEALLERYPHQLSGGQQQRVVIAMALLTEPVLLVLDEPTTGLDVTVEAAVLDLLASLRRRFATAFLFISHNLGAVARVCDRVGVMYGGEIVEEGPTAEVLRRPRHPYTRGLLACAPAAGADKRAAPLDPIRGQVPPLGARPAGCFFAPRCPHALLACSAGPIALGAAGPGVAVRCIRAAELPPWARATATAAEDRAASDGAPILLAADGVEKSYARTSLLGRRTEARALGGVSLDAAAGRTLAIVGESGCGKSTFAKVVTGLEAADGGALRFDGGEIGGVPVARRDAGLKRRIQMVFQNPDATLNPSHSVGFAIGRAVERLKGLGGARRDAEVARLLELVRLPAEAAGRMPRQLSGGQKQRVAIARALAGDAELIVADEPVSALDMSVQASVINLILELQREAGLTLLFISHDLAVVRYLADSVAVMYFGRVVEFGSADQVFAPPHHPYTEALLAAAPKLDGARPRVLLEGSPPSAQSRPPGCVFAARCPRKLGPVCDETPPPEQTLAGHRIACHIPRDDLLRLAESARLEAALAATA